MQQGGLGRHSHPGHSSGAGSPAFLEEDGALPVNTWLGFVVDPITPCVLLAPVKHVIMLATLKRLGGGTSPGPDSMGYFGVSIDETFPPALLELEEGLHHFGQATEAGSCSGHPSGQALQPEVPTGISICSTLPWTGASDAGAGKQADHAWVGGWCSDVPNPDKSRVKWFQHRITPEGEPWAFTTGDPQRAIAALELFGLLLLVRAVLLCAAGSASHTWILVASDNQGNVFSLLNDSTRRMPNAAILMEIVLTLHDHQVMLGPSHVKRDFNTWADELTHPDPQFPTENRVFPSVESELIKLIFATFLPHP